MSQNQLIISWIVIQCHLVKFLLHLDDCLCFCTVESATSCFSSESTAINHNTHLLTESVIPFQTASVGGWATRRRNRCGFNTAQTSKLPNLTALRCSNRTPCMRYLCRAIGPAALAPAWGARSTTLWALPVVELPLQRAHPGQPAL